MRLSVCRASNTPQVLIDLKKIYKPYFDDLQLTDKSLIERIESPNSQLYVTLFNERHLGAVQVEVKGLNAQFSLLTIRDLTRRRGIAKNLLREVEKQLKSEGVTEVSMSLESINKEEQQGLSCFLLAQEYQEKEGVFKKIF
jgi:ribosomal protein S18 acetylase RimI-like enzyme